MTRKLFSLFTKRILVVIAFICYWLLAIGCLYGQCAMCKAAIETSAEGQKIARNLNNAILFLLGAPYIVFGTTAYFIYKQSKTPSQK